MKNQDLNHSELLKDARTALGLNQSEAAERCHVSFSAYEKWERGHTIKLPMLVGCLVLLGVAPSKVKSLI